jgi:hypothetical protein
MRAIHLLLCGLFSLCVTGEGEIKTIVIPSTIASRPDREEQIKRVEVPNGNVIEILGVTGGGAQGERPSLSIIKGSSETEIWSPLKPLTVNLLAGPTMLQLYALGRRSAVMSYRIIPNPGLSQPRVTPQLKRLGTDPESLLMGFEVSPNEVYHLGISKDLKTWEPLFDFTSDSNQLDIKVPKPVLGDKSFLKLE